MVRLYSVRALLGVILGYCSLLPIASAQQAVSPAPYIWENKLIPPSPEAGALSKVDLNPTVSATGKAPFSIPLYTLAAGGIQVPVQLVYTGGNGIRVNETASNVGLGWVLDAGGVISVTVHGKPDLYNDSYRGHRSFHPALSKYPASSSGYLWCDGANPSSPVNAEHNYAEMVNEGLLDSQPDEFNLKMPGAQTAFALDSTGACYAIPHSNIRIFLKRTAADDPYFEAVDASGNHFIFDQRERTSTISRLNGSTVRPTNGGPYISGFYLSKIINPYGEEILLTYESVFYRQELGTDLEVFHFNSCLDNGSTKSITDAYTVRQQSFTAPRLTSIQAKTGRLDVIYDAQQRLDNPGTNRIAGLTVTTAAGQAVKNFVFAHSYFKTARYAVTDTATQHLYARLKLLSVQENTLPPHVFSYDTLLAVPSRLSFAQDHFGYYNGRDGNQNLIGDLSYDLHADREPDSLACRFALLRSIRYPTGGQQRITYEAPHQLTTSIKRTTYADATLNAGMDTTTQTTMVLGHTRKRSISWILPNTSTGCRSTVAIVQLPLTSTSFQFHASGTSDTTSLVMPKGTYRVTVNNRACQQDGAFISVRYDTLITSQVRLPLYGVRCKKLGFYDSNNRLVKTVSFRFKGTQANQVQPYRRQMYTTKSSPYGDVSCDWSVYMGSQVYTLGFPEAPVYYQQIEQYQDTAQTQGKTVYTYENGRDDVYKPMPGLVPTSYAWLRGQLTDVDHYVQQGGVYSPVKKTQYVYALLHDPEDFWDFQLAPKARHDLNIVGVYIRTVKNLKSLGGCNEYDYGFYKLPSVVRYLSKEIETRYASTDTFQTTKRFYVTNFEHLQPSITTQVFSPQDSASTHITYPSDLDLSSSSPDGQMAALLKLRSKGILTAPVEEIQYRQNKVVKAARFDYSAAAVPVRQKEYAARLAAPSSNFRPARISNGLFTADPSYQPDFSYDLHDRLGNPLQITASADRSNAYLWDEIEEHLLMVARNAQFSQVAATSFESTNSGRWRYDQSAGGSRRPGGRTGRWAYLLTTSSVISSEQLPADDYELSFWVQGSGIPQLQVTGGTQLAGGPNRIATAPGDWQQYRTRLHFTSVGQVSLGATGTGPSLLVDELRLHPVGAQMTTYTHEPLVGLTSQTGPDGRTSYYEYDALGRLLRVRDEQGRILSQQEYQYATQP
ncbi:YD repeat protein [Hymenobacter roseosalivarius DSM 11622]|uniref:YD repeat protein n=1 Tax=Hymenobacter roseosalivarius DSM 11622 TaxID=645990 RepID=A0A1W1W507_9BACT|nr:RHS repeat domain-containing protein [Hymenobacter roseosalivarius]SMC00676.1 YD repeat protein [Hymenobacter roseosalivarius DSM 11622]